MTRQYLIILLFFLSCTEPDYQEVNLSEKNLTTYTYNFSMEAVKASIVAQFQNYNYRKMGLYYTDNFYPDSLRLFEQPGNKDDFCLSTYDDPIGKSYLYFIDGKSLDYIASFHLHVSQLDSLRTKVEVKTLKSKIITGKKLIPNIHGVRPFNYKEIEPSTIEEYEILLLIGKKLGQEDMPELKKPK